MREAASIISQAAEGLGHAHSRGLIHRDVKPGNLLVTPEGRCKVSDLGLAAILGDEENDPRAGRVVGTADYISPEHILTPTQLTPASDIYSLGCTLYYAITGKVPFPAGNPKSKCKRHCESAPLNPRRFNPNLDEGFLDVLAAMMEKDPRQRIATAEDVVRRLAPWASEGPPGSLTNWLAGISQGAGGGPGTLAETQPEIFEPVYESSDEAPSQVSQGTDAVAQDTRREPLAPLVPDASFEVPVLWVALAVAPLALAAAALLVSLVVKALK
jgi:serine/threonine protein kinase